MHPLRLACTLVLLSADCISLGRLLGHAFTSSAIKHPLMPGMQWLEADFSHAMLEHLHIRCSIKGVGPGTPGIFAFLFYHMLSEVGGVPEVLGTPRTCHINLL